MSLLVAIVGKPNVGKSTIFNRFCGRRLAITHDKPGITRDAKISDAKVGKVLFKAIDTAGLDDNIAELTTKMKNKTLDNAKRADVILFVVDGRLGINEDDLKFANVVRKFSKEIVLLVNKCESKTDLDHKALYKLGFGEPLYISAEHNLGFKELEIKFKELSNKIFPLKEEVDLPYKRVKSISKRAVIRRDEAEKLAKKLSIENAGSSVKEDESLTIVSNADGSNNSEENCIKISLVGRPNVGKSTLFNKLLGFERSIVSPLAGTTRDSINHYFSYKDVTFELIDTAGLRRKARIDDNIEALSAIESINAIRRSHVVLLVVDATQALEKQDLHILRVAINEGKAIVLIVNKKDLIEDQKLYLKELNEFVENNLYEIQGVKVLFISASEENTFNSIFESIIEAEKIWKTKLSTQPLNQWISEATSLHIPPLAKNSRRIRIKYATQTGIRPVTLTLFGNILEDLPLSYTRYLYNSLRKTFKLWGCPIRIKYKKTNNPYSNKR